METRTMNNPFDLSHSGGFWPYLATVMLFVGGKILGFIFSADGIQNTAYVIAIINGLIAIFFNPNIRKATKSTWRKISNWFKKK
jgi:hypothetical protein